MVRLHPVTSPVIGVLRIEVHDGRGNGAGLGDDWRFSIILDDEASRLTYVNSEGTETTILDLSQDHEYDFTFDPGPTPALEDDSVSIHVSAEFVATLKRADIVDLTALRPRTDPVAKFGVSRGMSDGVTTRWYFVDFAAIDARP